MGRGAGSGQGHTRQCQYFESVRVRLISAQLRGGSSDPPAGVGGDNAKKGHHREGVEITGDDVTDGFSGRIGTGCKRRLLIEGENVGLRGESLRKAVQQRANERSGHQKIQGAESSASGNAMRCERGRAKEGRLRSQPPESVAKIAGLGLAGGAIVHRAT